MGESCQWFGCDADGARRQYAVTAPYVRGGGLVELECAAVTCDEHAERLGEWLRANVERVTSEEDRHGQDGNG